VLADEFKGSGSLNVSFSKPWLLNKLASLVADAAFFNGNPTFDKASWSKVVIFYFRPREGNFIWVMCSHGVIEKL
jgi:hypothetical protein